MVDQNQEFLEGYKAGLAHAALEADGSAVPEGREPAAVTEQPDWQGLCEKLLHALEGEGYANWAGGPDDNPLIKNARATLARWGRHPAPPAEVTPGPSMEDVGTLIAWLIEQACQAADASQPTDAGMLTWAAQVIGERVDEDAPDPPVAEEVGELVARLPLSPAARAVLDATDHEPMRRAIAADILRALADQVVPEDANAVGDEHDEARQDQWLRIRWKILAIAAELEGANV